MPMVSDEVENLTKYAQISRPLSTKIQIAVIFQNKR
jgi:hypothetical protein